MAEETRPQKLKRYGQVVIGMVTIGGLAVSAVENGAGWSTSEATEQLLGGIGLGLAASAVIELAYTLSTPGPDEVLDPLMLGLASSMLLVVGGIDTRSLTLAKATALLVLGVLLALLFAVRLLLAEVHEAEGDRETKVVWWSARRRP